jgi:hypothetical protein
MHIFGDLCTKAYEHKYIKHGIGIPILECALENQMHHPCHFATLIYIIEEEIR